MVRVGFLNLYKLVETWVGNGAVPPTLKAPLLGFIELSPLAWFCIVWWTAATVGGVLLLMHQRRRLDIVPETWTGKGQLLYVLFLWLMVIGNLARAIPGFSNGRMVTEWVVFMNASLATLLIVALRRKMQQDTNDDSGAVRRRAGVAFARKDLAARVGSGDRPDERLRLFDVGYVPTTPRR